ncbi:unnamed protein product, partial [Laminaria digitata]
MFRYISTEVYIFRYFEAWRCQYHTAMLRYLDPSMIRFFDILVFRYFDRSVLRYSDMSSLCKSCSRQASERARKTNPPWPHGRTAGPPNDPTCRTHAAKTVPVACRKTAHDRASALQPN